MGKPACSRICSATLELPEAWPTLLTCLLSTDESTATRTATNSSQAPTAVFQWLALHCPARAAGLFIGFLPLAAAPSRGGGVVRMGCAGRPDRPVGGDVAA
jgi:hypothetical protein